MQSVNELLRGVYARLPFSPYLALPCPLTFFFSMKLLSLSHPEPFFSTAVRHTDLPAVQRLALPSHVTSGHLTTDHAGASVATAAADVDLPLGSSDQSDDPLLHPEWTPPTT